MKYYSLEKILEKLQLRDEKVKNNKPKRLNIN